MKTVEIVKTEKGWHVTRRYCGRARETAFFAFNPKKKKQTEANEAKDKYVQAWVCE